MTKYQLNLFACIGLFHFKSQISQSFFIHLLSVTEAVQTNYLSLIIEWS